MLAALLTLGTAAAEGTRPAPEIAGPPETVYDWSTQRCETWDIPDTPARAWRDAAGDVRLVAGAEASRASRGPDLDRLARDCAVLHRGAEADDPGAYDDRSWIAATRTEDGRRVEALAHVEYHGQRRPGRCASPDYAACWRNAIVALASDDGGASFAREGLVAALPYRYAGTNGRRAGYFNPSNILRDGDSLYAFVFAERFRAQKRGVCLLRRPVEGGAEDWRAWDGRGFTVRFADPYREAVADPSAHVCTPLPGLASTLTSVVRDPATGTWLAVTPTTRPGPDGAPLSGIWWTASDDLVHWSEPALLHEVPLLWRRDCGAPAAYAYPSLLDPDSGGLNFDTVDAGFWLYLVEMPLDADCGIGPERDLIRLPVTWPEQ